MMAMKHETITMSHDGSISKCISPMASCASTWRREIGSAGDSDRANVSRLGRNSVVYCFDSHIYIIIYHHEAVPAS